MLYPLLSGKSPLNNEYELTLYKALMRPNLTYACPVWKTIEETKRNKIQVVTNKCIRMMLNMQRDLNTQHHYTELQIHEQVKLPTVWTHITQIAKKSFIKCKEHQYYYKTNWFANRRRRPLTCHPHISKGSFLATTFVAVLLFYQ